MKKGMTIFMTALVAVFLYTFAAQAAAYDEAEILARCVYAEARGDKYEGQLAVASVVLNRLEDGRWGDTVDEVINSRTYNGKKIGKQFAYWRGYIKEPLAFESCRDAALEALYGYRNLPEDIYYFQMIKRKKWYGATLYKRIGCHFFYQGG